MNDSSSATHGLGQAAEAEAFLASHAEVEAVQLVITDANGVGRGKNIAREELLPLFEHFVFLMVRLLQQLMKAQVAVAESVVAR